MIWPVVAWMMRMSRSLIEHEDGGSGVGSADADVVQPAGVAEADVCRRCRRGRGGPGAAAGCRWCLAGRLWVWPGRRRRGASVQGAVWPAGVVVGDEGVERVCSSAIVAGWLGWACSHFFRVCWKRSTLPQVVGWFGLEFFWTTPRSAQLGLEAVEGVAAGGAAGEAGGEDHAVVGQHRGGYARGQRPLAGRRQTMRPGDRRWAGDREGVAGVVVEQGTGSPHRRRGCRRFGSAGSG